MFELNQPRRKPNDPQASVGSANEVELRSDSSYVQWRYKGFAKWNNLISIKELKGEAGKDGKNGLDGAPGQKGDPGQPGKAGAVGPRGPQGPMGTPGIDGLDGKNGAPGKEIELNKSDTHVQWRKAGDTQWQDLILLTAITGAKGDPGEKGEKGDQGERGMVGAPGAAGARGPQGYTGPAGPTGPQGPAGQDAASNVFIQETEPTVTQPSMWIETESGIVKTLWLVTQD